MRDGGRQLDLCGGCRGTGHVGDAQNFLKVARHPRDPFCTGKYRSFEHLAFLTQFFIFPRKILIVCALRVSSFPPEFSRNLSKIWDLYKFYSVQNLVFEAIANRKGRSCAKCWFPMFLPNTQSRCIYM